MINTLAIGVAVCTLALAIFVADLLTPLGIAAWMPYVLVVLLALWLPRRGMAAAVTALCTVLIIVGYFYSPDGIDPWLAAVNRAIAIFSLWMTLGLGLALQRLARLQRFNRALASEIEERRQVEQRLREQALLLDLSPDAIMVRDLNHRITYWNRGAERLYGWQPAEVVGRSAVELLHADERTLPTAQQALRASNHWSREVQHRTKSGRMIQVESRWTLVLDADQRPASIVVINTDVTERRQLESQLLRTQRLEGIGVLAGGVAHDFNNLLTPMLMTLSMLRERRSDDERIRLLDILQSSAQRGSELVRQLLAFAGGGDRTTAPLQLQRLFVELSLLIEHTFPKSIAIDWRCPAGLYVQADSTQLMQVLMNLCLNSRDAMAQGGQLTIAADRCEFDASHPPPEPAAAAGEYVRIQVSDTGAGIAPEVIERIFDPFFSTKGPSAGTGLGLSTVLGIVRGHGGFVRVASQLGEGTTFSVFLPALARVEPSSATPAPSTAARGHGQRILVVDDEPLIRETVRTNLTRHGYDTATEVDGPAAVQWLVGQNTPVDLAIIDRSMPGLDGWETARRLVEIQPELPVLIVSGRLPDHEVPLLKDAGYRFLAKPFLEAELLAAVDEALVAVEPAAAS